MTKKKMKINKQDTCKIGETIYVKVDVAKRYHNQKEIFYKNWIYHKDMEKMVKFTGEIEE
jgi:hypothetical protein